MLKKMLILLIGLVIFSLALVFTILDPLQKRSRAGLQIEYLSGSASVFLNDNYLGKAPLLEEKLKSGEYILKIDPDNKALSSLNLPIYLEKGTITIVVYNPGDTPRTSSSTIFELKKRTNKSSAVSFETYPENALVSFDHQEVNFSPFTIDPVNPGEHHFLVNLPSYEAQDHSFLVLAGYETKITVNLAKNLKIIDNPQENAPVKNEAVTDLIQNKIEESTTSSQSVDGS